MLRGDLIAILAIASFASIWHIPPIIPGQGPEMREIRVFGNGPGQHKQKGFIHDLHSLAHRA